MPTGSDPTPTSKTWLTDPRAALGACLMASLIALVLVLLHAPATVAHTNGISDEEQLNQTRYPASVCQAGELLPRDTSAIVVSLSAFTGPRITLEAKAAGQVLTRGEQAPGWSGKTVTIPVREVAHTATDVDVCMAFAPVHETISAFGTKTKRAVAAAADGGHLRGRLSIEYLRPGSRSWWSLASSTMHTLGLGRAAGGTWIAFLAIALMVGAAGIACRLFLRELR
jgi:hypothetical protein